jgi:hypothetical protein
LGIEEPNESAGVMLLTHIREVFAASSPVLTSTDLVRSLKDNEGWPGGEWRRGSPITPHGVARLLKQYGIAPRKGRLANQYARADFVDAWQRYLPGAGSPGSSSTFVKTGSDFNALVANQRSPESFTLRHDVELAKTHEKPVLSASVEDVEVWGAGRPGEG